MARARNPEEKYTRPLQEIQGVAAGQTATIRLPIGPTYHQLFITYAGVTLAQMTELRLVANGRPLMVFPGADKLDILNQYEGRAAAAGVLTVDLERYGLATKPNREMTVIGTGHPEDPNPIRTLSLEIDIAAAAAAPAFSAKARQSASKKSGLVKHVRKYILNPAGAGDFEWSQLPAIGALNKIYFIGANIDSLKVELDNFKVFDRTATENELIQSDGIRVPQADVYVLDPSEIGDGGDQFGLVGAEDVRFTLGMGGAATVVALAEFLAPVGA